jgi:hypothetical protein
MVEYIEVDYINVDLITILRQSTIDDKVVILEKIGYEKDEEFHNPLLVYINKCINAIIVILPGLNIRPLIKSPFCLEEIHRTVINADNLNILYEEGIKKVCDKYNNKHNIIFIGHSFGGLVINSKLNNTIHKCYCYNSCFVNERSSNNINNYRTNCDLLSIGLIDKETETIYINLLEYLIKQKGNLLDFFIEVHETTIFTKVDNLNIMIPIPSGKKPK